MTLIVVVASLTLLSSFLCSLFEAALYSITPSQIGVLRAKGGAGAERLARMREDVEGPIAAILTVNTIAHTVGAAWCGALVGQHYGSGKVGLFAAIFTVLVLVLTEIIPKSLGVRYATTLGPKIVWPLQIMIWLVWPIVWMATKAMGLLSGGAKHGPSEDEVVVVSGLAAKGGAMRKEEHRWVENALALDKVTAADLRTPRIVVETLDANQSVLELIEHAERWSHSRVPLTEGGNPDKIIGLVHRREVFDAALAGESAKALILRDLMRPMKFVPESTKGHELLKFFLEERAHMVAVADEYGGFEGVVTLEDVLESLLGEEIVDEHDQFGDMQELARERSKKRLEGLGAEDS
ncbi:MAG: hemolysin family protein [Planctomycetota bacterium]